MLCLCCGASFLRLMTGLFKKMSNAPTTPTITDKVVNFSHGKFEYATATAYKAVVQGKYCVSVGGGLPREVTVLAPSTVDPDHIRAAAELTISNYELAAERTLKQKFKNALDNVNGELQKVDFMNFNTGCESTQSTINEITEIVTSALVEDPVTPVLKRKATTEYEDEEPPGAPIKQRKPTEQIE